MILFGEILIGTKVFFYENMVIIIDLSIDRLTNKNYTKS